MLEGALLVLQRLAAAIAILRLAVGHHLLLGSPLLQLTQPLLLGRVNDVVVAAPVRIIVLEVRHGHALPEAQLLPRGDSLDATIPAALILVVPTAEGAEALVGAGGVGLHLPDLLAEAAVLTARLVELGAVGAVPGCDVGDVLGLVLVELLEEQGEDVGVLGEEVGVGVAAVLGLFEGLGEEGYEGVEVLFLG